MILFQHENDPEGRLLQRPDGMLLAVCPGCGRGVVIEPIPVLAPIEEDHAMYLACESCGQPFHVIGNFYVVVEEERGQLD